MRKKLEPLDGQRCTFRAVFREFGAVGRWAWCGSKAPALFVDVTGTTGEELTDHVWMAAGPTMPALDLQPGDPVEFVATVRGYLKGYGGDECQSWDYKLAYAAEWRKLARSMPIGEDDDSLQREFFSLLYPMNP